MFTTLLDLFDRFKEWGPQTKIMFLIVLSFGIYVFYTQKAIQNYETELLQLKSGQAELISKIHNDCDNMITKIRDSYQIKIDDYIYRYDVEKDLSYKAIQNELQETKNELKRIQRELKSFKNDLH